MRKNLVFFLILMMIPFTAVLANANYHVEPVSKDSYGVSARNITFDKSLDFSQDGKLSSGTAVWSYRIILQTKSSVKIFITGKYLNSEIQVPNGSDFKTLARAESDKNGTKIISQVLYSGMYYIVFGYSVPEGSSSLENIRIVINPV